MWGECCLKIMILSASSTGTVQPWYNYTCVEVIPMFYKSIPTKDGKHFLKGIMTNISMNIWNGLPLDRSLLTFKLLKQNDNHISNRWK